jgi:hypothetical protein
MLQPASPNHRRTNQRINFSVLRADSLVRQRYFALALAFALDLDLDLNLALAFAFAFAPAFALTLALAPAGSANQQSDRQQSKLWFLSFTPSSLSQQR